MLRTLTFSSLLLVSNAFASHHYSKRLYRPSENEIDNNQEPSDISASSTYGAVPRDYSHPTPFAKHQRTPPRAPTRLRPDLSPDDKTDFGSSYILTAGGREKIYDGEGETKIAPHATPFTAHYAKKSDKSKKYRFAYNLGAKSPIVVNPTTAEPKDAATAATAAPDIRTFNSLGASTGPPVAHHKLYADADLYKGTVWKQLGPNVEISSAAEHIPFTRLSKERKKSKAAQQRKNGPKNLRTGFMTSQQHALYVANSLKGFKGANFDHSNVLKQSDKFELTDAMISEAEKEELKNTKLQVRFKELPGQAQPFQSADPYEAPQSIQYYSQTAPFSVVAQGAPLVNSAQLGTLGKGFVRHIEVEMSATGGRKMVPALIIPLTETANYNDLAPVIVNQPERKPAFPYDIVAPRYGNHDISAITSDNYHLQPFQLNYQYKTQLGDEAYPYSPYHNHLNTRFAYINDGATTAPAQSTTAHEKRSRYRTSAHAHQSAKKPAHHLVAEQSEQKVVTVAPSVTSIATFIYDGDAAHLAPSESSYFATMASTRDETRSSSRQSGKHYEKNDVRRDK